MPDSVAHHVPSYYAATTASSPTWDPLQGQQRSDVCIIGGGFTGLSAALQLARRGRSVTLLEAGPIAWGASGRNGGQVHVGWRRGQQWLEKAVGLADAKRLWSLALDARSHLDWLIDEFGIQCDFGAGHVHGDHKCRFVERTRREVDHLRDCYGYEHVRHLSRDEIRTLIDTEDYFGGSIDSRGGHLHPLNLAIGIARLATDAGAILHPDSPVEALRRSRGGWQVETRSGSVLCDAVLLACGGYSTGLSRTVDAHVMPINNYIAVTEKLGDAEARAIINGTFAVSDSRFVVRYYRMTADNRLLFGGGENYSYRFPADIAAFVRPFLARVFPRLESVPIDYAWGGTLSVTPTRLPFVRQLQPGLFNVSGFSGLGVVLAPYFGKIAGDAIAGDRDLFDRLSRLPVPAFPGGRWLRWPTLVAAMSVLALRDRL